MDNNLPMKKDESFFGKIRTWIRGLFIKPKNDLVIDDNIRKIGNEKEEILSTDNISQINMEDKFNSEKIKFEDSLRVDLAKEESKDDKKEEFLDEIEQNPALLYELPIEKLEKLESYYKESINNYEEKLNNLKKAS